MNKPLTLLEAMEKAEGKSITLAYCNNVLTNPLESFVIDIKAQELKYTIKYAITAGFSWAHSKEGHEFWT